jgi:hypothetical protein
VFDVAASAQDRVLATVILAQEGVLTRAQALARLSPSAVRHRVASGRWRRLHRGIYVTSTGPLTRAQRRWIAVLAAGPAALLAGVSALELWGLRGYDRPTLHVLIPAGRSEGNPPTGVVVHRVRRLSREDVARANTPPCTSPSRSLIDAARWAGSDDDAAALIAAAYQQRIVRHPSVVDALARCPRLERRSLIERVAADANGGSHSLAELGYLAAARRAGLPEPSRQHIRRDAAGRRRYLDLWYETYKVIVEIDGAQHLEARAAWDDMRRQNDLWVAGARRSGPPAGPHDRA